MSFNQKRRLKNPNPFKSEHGVNTQVRVLTGRTRGKVFTVTGIFTDKNGKLFAYIADGEKYTGINPKKKSASHLETVRNGTDREKGNEEK